MTGPYRRVQVKDVSVGIPVHVNHLIHWEITVNRQRFVVLQIHEDPWSFAIPNIGCDKNEYIIFEISQGREEFGE